VGGGEEDAFEEGEGFLGGMFAEALFPGFGRLDFPDGFHLFVAVEFFHEFVVEGVARFFVAGGPDDGFGGVGEIAAREIGRRVGLDPGNVVEEFEAELLHGEADGVDDVGGAGDPEGAVGFEDALAGGEPGAVEVVIGVRAAGFVPIAFVDGDHFAGMASDAAVGEEIGRVGEDKVDGGLGEEGEEFEGIALVKADVVLFVVEDGGGEFDGGLGHCWATGVDRSGSLIRWETESSELTAYSRQLLASEKRKIQRRGSEEGDFTTEGTESTEKRGPPNPSFESSTFKLLLTISK